MKSLLYVTLLYLCLAFLAVSCSSSEPVPACTTVEVMGQNCDTGWYILKLQDNTEEVANKSGSYVGQLHGGYVTTDNLPEELRQVGQKAQLRLELNDAYGPRCVATAIMYPAVRVTEVCGATTK